METVTRVKWIDVAKCFGMFFIYVGHFGNTAGKIYPWVFSFHVALFFFLSGCVENYNKADMLENIWKKFVNIIIPFFFFGILGIVYSTLSNDSLKNIKFNIKMLAIGGIRNHITVGIGLWFLSCLFVMEVMFTIIKRCKVRWLILVICLEIFCIVEFLIFPSPTGYQPKWWWNIDSACHYLIFYGLGYVSYPWINKVFETKNRRINVLYKIIFCLCAVYSIALFWKYNFLLPVWSMNTLTTVVGKIMTPMISIIFIVGVSEFFSESEILGRLGRGSLYLCGNEYIVKNLVPMVISMFGLTLNLNSPIQVYIYTFVLLIIVDIIFMPAEKKILGNIQNKMKIGRKTI